jgi:hypothetical protein
MNVPKDMETDVIAADVPEEAETDVIALLSRLILDKDDDTPVRLREQEDALKDLRCSDRRLGVWIEKWDFPFLIETLMLSDAVFSREFPDVRTTAEKRKELAHALEAHCETCPRCHRKRSYDLEWQARVNRVFAENKRIIGKTITNARGKNKRD